MANREENLKKINAELEMLSDEELENVAGGCWYETSNDSKFLNVLLRGTEHHRCDRYGRAKIAWGYDKDVIDSWSSVGIRMKPYGATLHNEYFLNGKQISRDEAWAHAEKFVASTWNAKIGIGKKYFAKKICSGVSNSPLFFFANFL